MTLLGLGPGDPTLLTRAALDHLHAIDELVLRTRIHPTVTGLPSHLRLESYDHLYETAPNFETIYRTIAQELLSRLEDGASVTYAVPGHPLVAEATSRHLLGAARSVGVPTRIIAGISFIEPVCELLELDPFDRGLQLLDCLDLAPPSAPPWNGDDAWIHKRGGEHYQAPVAPYPLTPTRPALLAQLFSREVASEAKLTLLQRYPPEHPISIVWAAGVDGAERTKVVPLDELDHQTDLNHLCVAYLPPLEPIDDRRGIDGIEWVVARLLGPGGCPWDREQTHLSLRPFLLEETHEALEALDAGDQSALAEELGDVLLQVLLHSEMGRQSGGFDFGDLLEELTSKLIRRHPHVFDKLDVTGSAEVLRNWDTIKQAERAVQGAAPKGLLDGIPAGLPALATAQKLGERAAKVGFDWADIGGVWEKVREELDELRGASQAEAAEELGDLLFVLARLASWLGIDAESAVREANAKFRRRFKVVEELAGERSLAKLTAAELDELWVAAKTRSA